MAKKALFEPLKISPSQIFTVDTSLEPDLAAEEYQKQIEKHFAPKEPRFDLILLGLGDDAHTASLFPGTDVLNIQEPGVKDVFLPGKKVYRISFTAPLINLAHNINFLVFGSSKAEAVNHVLKGKKNPTEFPAQLIQPSDGDVVWFMDEAAAGVKK